jgi:gag-polypeptide of LTR copia-type
MINQQADKLTSVLLDDKNYNMWVRKVFFELISRDKLEYVNGDITVLIPEEAGAPTEEEKKGIKEWKNNDN